MTINGKVRVDMTMAQLDILIGQCEIGLDAYQGVEVHGDDQQSLQDLRDLHDLLVETKQTAL